ncbi:MAG: nucleotidyltransferase [Gammaproteobacteria bacterium]|nr:nucleotidyltransferase [Gammaproteobacteria bacterium]
MHGDSDSGFLASHLDQLLADVAIRIQLSQSNFNKAVHRYGAVSQWIERNDSPLKDRVELFYPQGSMAIGATIASKLRTDEFDIDVVAQLMLPESVAPRVALDLLFESIRGIQGSRYYNITKRRSRCVTVDYSDNMHLDVTPAVLRLGYPERESIIFHQRPETPSDPGYPLIANPYGFAEWFKRETPSDLGFASVFKARALRHEDLITEKMADSEPVEPQEHPFRMSRSVIALQLLKRWRNVQYDTRASRRPPSVMIAKLVADASGQGMSLSDELLKQATHMLALFREHDFSGRLVNIVNPVCLDDVLTDRWPESLASQRIFVNDLEGLVAMLTRLVSGAALDDMQGIMMRLFGEAPTSDVFREHGQRIGDAIAAGESRHDTGTGGLVVPTTGSSLGTGQPTQVRRTPRHRFFGD